MATDWQMPVQLRFMNQTVPELAPEPSHQTGLVHKTNWFEHLNQCENQEALSGVPETPNSQQISSWLSLISSAHNVAAQGKYIAITSTTVETDSPESEVQPALELLELVGQKGVKQGCIVAHVTQTATWLPQATPHTQSHARLWLVFVPASGAAWEQVTEIAVACPDQTGTIAAQVQRPSLK
ncbi:UNVERIFIED_CONTAM: hypothetical protein K2H54_048708, partial [Gekko kuhli]